MSYKELHTVFDVETLVRGYVFRDQPYETIVHQFRYGDIFPYVTPSILDEYIKTFGLRMGQDTKVWIGRKNKLVGVGTKDKIRSFIRHNIGSYGVVEKEFDSGFVPELTRSESLDTVYKYIVGADRATQLCGREVHLVTENQTIHDLADVLAPLSINVIAGLDYLSLLGL